jgi:hypothetical protein
MATTAKSAFDLTIGNLKTFYGDFSTEADKIIKKSKEMYTEYLKAEDIR